MKTGTFLCWLFGHKFLHNCRQMNKSADDTWRMRHWTEKQDFCDRCGIDKEPKCPSN